MLTRLGASEPVIFIGDLRDAVRAPDCGEDDARLEAILFGETQRYEDFTRRFVALVDLEYRGPRPGIRLYLPALPVQEVTEAAWADAAGAETVIPDADYVVRGSMIEFMPDAMPLPREACAVRVRFRAGYETGSPLAFADVVHIVRMVDRVYNHGTALSENEMRSTMAHRRILR